jgi:hypothetical protein
MRRRAGRGDAAPGRARRRRARPSPGRCGARPDSRRSGDDGRARLPVESFPNSTRGDAKRHFATVYGEQPTPRRRSTLGPRPWRSPKSFRELNPLLYVTRGDIERGFAPFRGFASPGVTLSKNARRSGLATRPPGHSPLAARAPLATPRGGATRHAAAPLAARRSRATRGATRPPGHSPGRSRATRGATRPPGHSPGRSSATRHAAAPLAARAPLARLRT